MISRAKTLRALIRYVEDGFAGNRGFNVQGIPSVGVLHPQVVSPFNLQEKAIGELNQYFGGSISQSQRHQFKRNRRGSLSGNNLREFVFSVCHGKQSKNTNSRASANLNGKGAV